MLDEQFKDVDKVWSHKTTKLATVSDSQSNIQESTDQHFGSDITLDKETMVLVVQTIKKETAVHLYFFEFLFQTCVLYLCLLVDLDG